MIHINIKFAAIINFNFQPNVCDYDLLQSAKNFKNVSVKTNNCRFDLFGMR